MKVKQEPSKQCHTAIEIPTVNMMIEAGAHALTQIQIREHRGTQPVLTRILKPKCNQKLQIGK